MAEPVALATVEQLARWTQWEFGDDSPESAQAEDVLLMASEFARSIAGKLWATAEDAPRTVVGIVLAAARREIENPRRVSYEVKGPESASYNVANCPPGFFTDAEMKFLRKFRNGGGGLWSLSSYRDEDGSLDGYVFAGGGSKPMALYDSGDPGWEGTIRL